MARINREMRTLVSRSVLFHHAVADRLGLNVSELNCLGILESTGPTTAGALAGQTGLTTGAITGALDRLEAAGYVRRERDPQDRRRVIVSPMQVSPAVYGLFASLGEALEGLCSDYTDEQLESLYDFVRRAGPMTHAETLKLRAGEARAQRPPAGRASGQS